MDSRDHCRSCAGVPPYAEGVRIWLFDCGDAIVASRIFSVTPGVVLFWLLLAVSAILIEGSVKYTQ